MIKRKFAGFLALMSRFARLNCQNKSFTETLAKDKEHDYLLQRNIGRAVENCIDNGEKGIRGEPFRGRYEVPCSVVDDNIRKPSTLGLEFVHRLCNGVTILF